MTIKVFDVTKFQSKLNSYVCWNEHLSKETIDALKTVASWLNDDACMKVVSMEEHERLLARFRHLMESPYIRSFDQVDIKTGGYKRDIRLAIGPDEKLMEDGLDNCAFCGGKAEIITQKGREDAEGDFALENTIVCKECGAVMRGRNTVYKINTVGGLECVKDGRHELIKAWNRRPTNA